MSTPHTITLWTAPAAGGKSAAVIDLLREPREGKALVVVPSALQRRWLVAGAVNLHRVDVRQFYGLADQVLQTTGEPPAALDDPLRFALLRATVRDLAGEGRLPLLGGVGTKSGVVAQLGELFAALAEGEADPAALAAAGVGPYDGDLAAIYGSYLQRQEQHGVADISRRLALARDGLRATGGLFASYELLVVDGFDQFTPIQLDLIRELTRQIPRTVITLTYEAGERPALRRFARTYRQLWAALHPQVKAIALPPTGHHPSLRYLVDHLFALDTTPPQPAGDAVYLIAAADREREVRGALRRVKGLLAGGVPPEEVAILLRDGGEYSPLLREVAAEYALPLAFAEGLPLAEVPAIAALLTTLRLPLDDYPRRALVDAWRARGAFATDEADGGTDWVWAASMIDRAARAAGVPGGLERLRGALLALANATPPDDPDDERTRPVLAPQEATTLLALLDDFAATLIAPGQATVAEYVAWVDDGRWTMDDGPRTQNPEPRTQNPEPRTQNPEPRTQNPEPWAVDDELWAATPSPNPQSPISNPQSPIPDPHSKIQNPKSKIQNPHSEAWQRFELVLNDLKRADALAGEGPISYEAFVLALGAAVATARYGREEPRGGAVAVLPVLAARGGSFAHVVLLGLNEGEFPRTLPDPPIYTRRERERLRERGVPIATPDPADEQSLFYEALARARESVTLCHTYLDAAGNPMLPSPYLRALRELITLPEGQIEHIRAGSAPALNKAVSPGELLVAMVDDGRWTTDDGRRTTDDGRWTVDDGPQTVDDGPQTVDDGPWTMDDGRPHAEAVYRPSSVVRGPLWSHIQHAIAVETARLGAQPYGAYEGVIGDEGLLAMLGQRFGPGHRWSATQLNDYITCPFRFFAGHVLRLAPQEEPEAALRGRSARALRGQLDHAVLAEAARRWQEAGLRPHKEQEAALLDALDQGAAAVLAAAPTRFGFAPDRFWAWDSDELRRRLARALRRILAEGDDWAAFAPAALEQPFGAGGVPPLRLETTAGPVLVRGRIDRIDQREDGALAVIDYKSGSSPRSLRETLEGRDVQLPIYIHAVEQLLPLGAGQRVERAAFVQTGSGRRSSPLAADKREATSATMHERVAEVVAGVRAGRFTVRPRDDCPEYCAFVAICRVNKGKAAGGEQQD